MEDISDFQPIWTYIFTKWCQWFVKALRSPAVYVENPMQENILSGFSHFYHSEINLKFECDFFKPSQLAVAIYDRRVAENIFCALLNWFCEDYKLKSVDS